MATLQSAQIHFFWPVDSWNTFSSHPDLCLSYTTFILVRPQRRSRLPPDRRHSVCSCCTQILSHHPRLSEERGRSCTQQDTVYSRIWPFLPGLFAVCVEFIYYIFIFFCNRTQITLAKTDRNDELWKQNSRCKQTQDKQRRKHIIYWSNCRDIH